MLERPARRRAPAAAVSISGAAIRSRSAVTRGSSSSSAAVAARKRAAASASNASRGTRPYVTSADIVKGHQARATRRRAAAAAPPSSLKNCDCSTSSALGTAPGRARPTATRSPARRALTAAGSASSVVLQPNARSENVTSMIAATSAATLNATAAVCDQFRICHFAKRRRAARAACRSNKRATSGDARASWRNTAAAHAPGLSAASRSWMRRKPGTRPGNSSSVNASSTSCTPTSSASSRTTLTGCEPS